MFCICADSPVGAVVVYAPAVVDTYNTCPTDTLEVSRPEIVPKVTTCSAALSLASLSAKPKAGILEVSSALACPTVGVEPLTPDI